MPGKASKKRDLDDIQVLGVWNFTIQPETPLVWLRTGPLDRYLLRFSIHSHLPSTAGLIFHSEADGPGIDGVSFWIERRLQEDGTLTKRYVLAGEGLESKPLATKKYEDPGGEFVEDVEVLVQGFTACIFLQNRKVQIKCRTKASRGSMCFFNSTQATEDGLNDDVHFGSCRITALRRGPLEVTGILARREKALNEPKPVVQPEEDNALDPLQADGSIMFGDGEENKVGGLFQESVATTAPPESPEMSMHLTKSGTATTGTFYKTAASSPGMTRAGFNKTAMARGAFGGKMGSPNLTSSSMFSGRAGGQGKLRQTFSDGALRKSGVALCGLTAASKTRGFGDEWIPLVTNPPKSEQAFVREHAIKPSTSSRACQDFIKM